MGFTLRAFGRDHGTASAPSQAGRTGARAVTAAKAATATGLVAGLTAVELLLAAPATAATASQFARLRACESGGNYRINTGNGFYGAYQFDLGTWRGLGYSGYPHRASPAVQDQAARRLQAARGWAPWPACAAKLGLKRASRSRTRPG